MIYWGHGAKLMLRLICAVSKEIIWNNSEIKHENKILFYRDWYIKGIKQIEHKYDYRIKRFYPFKQVQNLYDIPRNDFLKYFHIVTHIKSEWKNILKEENPIYLNQTDKKALIF